MEKSAKYLQATHMSRYNTLVHSFKFSRLCHVYKVPVCNSYSVFKN